MERKLLFFPMLCTGIFAFADEPTDTINTQELNAVVVEASNQRTSSTASTYIPMARQKNAAVDAVSLLSQMAIPQLDVDPATQTVKTATGQSVSIFIDYVAATEQDLSGLRTTDVKKVEYLLYPQDPRFRGAQYVVNFIMQKYEWGGYTKINANKWFGVNRSGASVYSKFAYKAMTFDIYADEIYLTDRHTGSASTEIFHFPDLYGKGAQTIERESTPLTSHYRNNSNDVTFRALYSAENVQVSNMLSFNNTSTPRNNSENSLTYANVVLPSSLSKSISSNRSWGLNYDFETYLTLSQNSALNVEASYRYSQTNSKSDYSEDDLNIINNADEISHYAKITPSLLWNIDEHNSLMPGMHGEYTKSTIDYSGNSPSRQNYDVWGYWAGVRYSHVQEKWSAGTLFGWTYANTNLTGTKIEDNYPMGNVYATYSPNQHHQFEATYGFGKSLPDTYQKSPNMLQQDELMWYAGTPGLKNYWNNTINVTYTWLPNNRWQLEADGRLYLTNNRVVARYTPTAPDGTMLRQYVNSGSYRSGAIGLNGTAKFFGGKLIAKLKPEMWFRGTTGEYDMTYNELTCTAQLTWYFGNFYLFGWYMTPSTYPDEESGVKQRSPSRYQIQLGYGNGAWRASATAYNFLRTSWETNHQTLTSQYYQFDRREYGTNQHMRFQFSVTYTFGYGKKIQRGDEVSGVGAAGSAILK